MGIKHKRVVHRDEWTADTGVVQPSDWNDAHEIDGVLGLYLDVAAQPDTFLYVRTDGTPGQAPVSTPARALLAAATKAAMRAALDLNGVLDLYAGLAPLADTFLYVQSNGAAGQAPISASARALLAATTKAAMRDALDLATDDAPAFAGLTVTGSIANRGAYRLGADDVNVLSRVDAGGGVKYTVLYDDLGGYAIQIGGVVNAATYYMNTSHLFYNKAQSAQFAAINASGVYSKGSYYLGAADALFAARYATNYHAIYDPSGNPAIYVGGAVDPTNNFVNTTHRFLSRDGASIFAYVNSSGLYSRGSLYVGAADALLATSGGTYNGLYDRAAQAAILLGGSADPQNLYRNTSHNFGSIAGAATYALITASGVFSRGSLYVGAADVLLASSDTVYNRLFDRAGNAALLLGGTGSPVNYYRNTTHNFASIGGTTSYADISVNGIYSRNAFYVGASGYLFANILATNNLAIYDPGGNAAFYAGNSASPSNFYSNTSHFFYNRGTTVAYGVIDASGLSVAKDVLWKPSASVTPGSTGYLAIEAVSDTSIRFRYKGNDGTVRSSAAIALS